MSGYQLGEGDDAIFESYKDKFDLPNAMLFFTHPDYSPEAAASKIPALHAHHYPGNHHPENKARTDEWRATHKRMRYNIKKYAAKYIQSIHEKYESMKAHQFQFLINGGTIQNNTMNIPGGGMFGANSQTSSGGPSGFSSNRKSPADSDLNMAHNSSNNTPRSSNMTDQHGQYNYASEKYNGGSNATNWHPFDMFPQDVHAKRPAEPPDCYNIPKSSRRDPAPGGPTNPEGKVQPPHSTPKKHDRQEDEYGDARDAPDQGRYKEASNKKSRVNPPGREKEGGMPMDCISFKTDEDMSTCQGSFAAMSCATADIPVMNCSDKARACSSKFLSELAEKNAPVGCPVIRIEDSGDRKAQELMSHLISLQGRTETFNHATEAIDTASKYLKQIGRQRMQAEEMDAELARENAELKSKLKMNKSKMVENGTYKNVLNGAGNRCRAAAAKAEVVLELFEMNKPVVDKNGRMSKGDSKTWKAMFKRCIAANIDVGAIGEKIKKMFYRKRDQSESSYKFDPPRTKPSYNSDFGK
mmetsp:Transcript_11835/g.21018  ORF Transcript_11835/g.21018 Transcript_11835/m.21018 type:complete len:526 (-) Transcript_11835:187-1764(-)